jgi:hypothetical protein
LNIVEIPVITIAVLWTVAACLAAVISCILLFSLVKRFVAVRRVCVHRVILNNQGNVNSVYQLSVESPEPRLNFRFLVPNMPLVEVPVARFDAGKPTASPKANKASPRPVRGAVGQAEKSSRAVAQKSGMVASFLSAVGTLLPGQAGKALKQQGAAARQVSTKTTQTLGAKNQAERQVNAVQQGVSRLGVKTPAPAAHAQRAEAGTAEKVVAPALSYDLVAQTAPVSPGQSLPLALQISSPRKRIPEGSYLYIITSQQVPLEKIDRETSPLTQQGMVYFPGVSAWRYMLPVLLNVFFAGAVVLALAYVLTLIWV